MEVSNRTKRILDLAKRVAQNSEHDSFKHGAVLVKGGSVLNVAHNKDQFNRFGNRFRDRGCGHATHHAELGAVLGLDRNLTQGSTIYVVRINKEGVFRNSKPCDMCHEVLKFVGVKKAVFTTGEKTVGKIKL
tara:strand:+ start:2513 stop:2908 length:396 start_codon:yes stop_codon:yes gene_type:complete